MKKGNKSYRTIVDSNIWISFLIGKNLRGLQNYIDSKNIKIITCNEQLIELSEVFKKPSLKKYFSKEQIIEFFELLDESSECVKISTKTNICRDPKDNYLVSLSLDSESDILITGDKDLLDLKKIGNTIVLKYTEFETLVK
jgi:uncharacterized protein